MRLYQRFYSPTLSPSSRGHACGHRDRFLAGIIMHIGPYTYELGDRIAAAPIAALWN